MLLLLLEDEDGSSAAELAGNDDGESLLNDGFKMLVRVDSNSLSFKKDDLVLFFVVSSFTTLVVALSWATTTLLFEAKLNNSSLSLSPLSSSSLFLANFITFFLVLFFFVPRFLFLEELLLRTVVSLPSSAPLVTEDWSRKSSKMSWPLAVLATVELLSVLVESVIIGDAATWWTVPSLRSISEGCLFASCLPETDSPLLSVTPSFFFKALFICSIRSVSFLVLLSALLLPLLLSSLLVSPAVLLPSSLLLLGLAAFDSNDTLRFPVLFLLELVLLLLVTVTSSLIVGSSLLPPSSTNVTCCLFLFFLSLPSLPRNAPLFFFSLVLFRRMDRDVMAL